MMHKVLFTCFFISVLTGLQSQPTEANLLGQWNDSTLVGSAQYNNTYNEIWGIAVNGHEYAIIGSTKGTHFIDVTDPFNPTETFFVKGKSSGSNIIHRDYHDYKGYLYAASDEGASSLQIIDISSLPDSVTVVYDDDDLFRTAHNIFIDSATARLYTCATNGGNTISSALRIYDISNPINPVYLSTYGAFGGYSVGHVHDVFVANDTAYLNCGNNGLVIASFKNLASPTVLSILRSSDYPDAGYNHSGWLSENKRYYFMGDETHGTDIKVFDMVDILNPKVVALINAGSSSSTSIPHNMMAKCNHLYVSYYYDGLQVYDISDPTNPIRELYYDTSNEPNGFSYKGAWGVYPFLPSGNILISDMQEGLFVFSPTESEICLNTTNTIWIESLNTEVDIWPTIVENGIVHLTFNEEIHETIEIGITSLSGQRVFFQKSLNSSELRSLYLPSSISAGMYLLTLNVKGQSITQKLLIP